MKPRAISDDETDQHLPVEYTLLYAPQTQSLSIFDELMSELKFHAREFVTFNYYGRPTTMPQDVAVHGHDGLRFKLTRGVELPVYSWTPLLLKIKHDLEAILDPGHKDVFNAVVIRQLSKVTDYIPVHRLTHMNTAVVDIMFGYTSCTIISNHPNIPPFTWHPGVPLLFTRPDLTYYGIEAQTIIPKRMILSFRMFKPPSPKHPIYIGQI